MDFEIVDRLLSYAYDDPQTHAALEQRAGEIIGKPKPPAETLDADEAWFAAMNRAATELLTAAIALNSVEV
jgi:hypothetical protein